MAKLRIRLVLSIIIASMHGHMGVASIDIGVCYGMNGDNLPPPSAVVALYKKYGINSMRLFDPNPQALEALRGSLIEVSLGVRNADIPTIASTQEAADSWFQSNVAPYLNDVEFAYISVGNEAIPGQYASVIPPAMQNLQNALNARNLAGIKVTTVVSTATLASSYPPSGSAFLPEASSTLSGVLQFLSAQGSPLMINVYPYFAYASDPTNVRLDYAQFTATGAVVVDSNLSYQNLFDAVVDSFYWAMEKLGVSDVGVAVSESGWPSAGNGNFTTPELAGTYNRNFIKRIGSNIGTPKRPGAHMDGFVFAIFNENLKPAGTEQNFGLFDPSMNPVYPSLPPAKG
ncbi:probable glucan endo-1,3-beta-glucosidase BG4 [Diospyros lotus]|uniref:probable glucan endo-1,3-beta-glucosidase BG4 n=1 Tax=Diospyros lotus TaxID=55363 RepID=UPI0022510B01|nr:probable glucan endo-1,3-beta-glucosidase BG4 [Diospyros lotus]